MPGRLKYKHDIHKGKNKTKYLIRDAVVANLKEVGIVNPIGTRKESQQQCIKLVLPIKDDIPVIIEG